MSDAKSYQTRTYFNGVAEHYGARSARGVWDIVRRREARAVWRQMGDVSGCRVLDLGCGAGYYASCALEAGAARVDAVDLSAKMIETLPPGITGYVGDIAMVHFPHVFDRIICAGALEFVDDPFRVMSNALRLCEVGGHMVVLVPTQGLIATLYKKFHARHGLDINTFSHATLRRMALETGWHLEAVASLLPFATVATFRKPLT